MSKDTRHRCVWCGLGFWESPDGEETQICPTCIPVRARFRARYAESGLGPALPAFVEVDTLAVTSCRCRACLGLLHALAVWNGVAHHYFPDAPAAKPSRTDSLPSGIRQRPAAGSGEPGARPALGTVSAVDAGCVERAVSSAPGPESAPARPDWRLDHAAKLAAEVDRLARIHYQHETGAGRGGRPEPEFDTILRTARWALRGLVAVLRSQAPEYRAGNGVTVPVWP